MTVALAYRMSGLRARRLSIAVMHWRLARQLVEAQSSHDLSAPTHGFLCRPVVPDSA